jgi:hypothetical protein
VVAEIRTGRGSVMTASLWGTFSVVDHLRRQPFVADVLLYDQLVVPVPSDEEEAARWGARHRQPDLQKDLIGVLGAHVVPVPWSLQLHDAWAARYDEKVIDKPDNAGVVEDLAQAVAFDANNVIAARGSSPSAQYARAENPDDPGLMITRMVLVDHINEKRDRVLLARIPMASEVEAVTAYGSYRDFRERRGELVTNPGESENPVFAFNWPFLVPSDTKRPPRDLLKQAVELAETDEVALWREAVQRWRRDTLLRGLTDEQATKELEGLIADYAKAARKLRIVTRTRWAVALTGAVAGIAAAAVFPPAGVVAATAALGGFVPKKAIPHRLDAGAIFYEARRRFA